MGAAVAVRRKQDEHEPAAAHAVLGPAEKQRRTPAMDKLLGLAKQNGLPQAERRQLVKELLKEELKAVCTLGASEVVHLEHLLHEGKQTDAVEKMVSMGIALHHAKEIATYATHALMSNVIGDAHLPGRGGIAVMALELAYMHTKIAVAIIREAHDSGDAQAAIASYAQTWARTVTAALYGDGVVRPEMTGLAHLDDARGKAFHDAMLTLRTLDADGAREIASALRDELGTPTNAFRALTETLLHQGGIRGVALYDAQVR